MAHLDRPDPRATAGRLRDAALELAAGVTDDLRRTDRYTRLRAAIVGAWAILAAASLWVACPPTGPTNSLGAVVGILPGTIMGTQVLVQNESHRHWTEVSLVLDGTWRAARHTIRSGDRLVLPVTSFRSGSDAAPQDLRPRTIAVECREGAVTVPIAAAHP